MAQNEKKRQEEKDMEQKRIREYGYRVGHRESGPKNKITDVPGVRVGHATVDQGKQHTGVTVIIPGEDNPFLKKYLAAAYVHNGFGKTCGLVQIQELGTIETPIALTNTLNVGKIADAMVSFMIKETEKDGENVYSINPVVGECNDSRINTIQNRILGERELDQAIRAADTDFLEGAVGAGTGTICYGLKGGIGSASRRLTPVSYTHLRAHETDSYLVCRLLLEKKNNKKYYFCLL